ncbi:unnamed protein product [Paramecium octaurelia]|uniref:Uncharacterized protein n=1 Tax=Paramecium octaurelia TaxID=43137 RepID=A0A8S1TSV9_PAROT|nr:unnamed protein product [Paramecium octaurelia]
MIITNLHLLHVPVLILQEGSLIQHLMINQQKLQKTWLLIIEFKQMHNFGKWKNEQFSLEVDDQINNTDLGTQGIYSICGSTELVNIFNIGVNLSHFRSQCQITMRTSLNTGTINAFWGIRAFDIYLAKCFTGCDQCIGPLKSDCKVCSSGWVFYKNLCTHPPPMLFSQISITQTKDSQSDQKNSMKIHLLEVDYSIITQGDFTLLIQNNQKILTIQVYVKCFPNKTINSQLQFNQIQNSHQYQFLKKCRQTFNSVIYKVQYDLRAISEQKLIFSTSDTKCVIQQVIKVADELELIKILEILLDDKFWHYFKNQHYFFPPIKFKISESKLLNAKNQATNPFVCICYGGAYSLQDLMILILNYSFSQMLFKSKISLIQQNKMYLPTFQKVLNMFILIIYLVELSENFDCFITQIIKMETFHHAFFQLFKFSFRIQRLLTVQKVKVNTSFENSIQKGAVSSQNDLNQQQRPEEKLYYLLSINFRVTNNQIIDYVLIKIFRMPKLPESSLNIAQKLKDEFLYHFDIFAQQPNFTILNRSKFPSILGFITSIMIALFGLYFFMTEVVSMVSKSKPAIYQTELSISETEPFILENDNFTLAISVVNRYSEPLIGIDRYFQLNISQCVRLRTKDQFSGNVSVNLNCTQIPIEPCNMSHFTTDLQKEYFSIIRMGGIQCINRKYLKENPLILQGQISSNAFRYIFIQFNACQNTSLSKMCAPQKEIESVLESGHYNVYKSDYLTKLDQPGQPYQEIITNEFTTFSLSTSKTISQKYRILQTSSDEGLIWESIQDQSNIQQSEWREISEFYNNQYIVVHYIRLDYKQTINIRTYVKLQTILGKLGGIFQIFIMVVAIVLRPIIENFMKLEIVDSLFNFSDQNHTPVQQSSHAMMIQTDRDTKLQIAKPNNQLKWQSPIQNTQHTTLSQSRLDPWLIIFGCNQSKKKQFIVAKNKINKYLEIVNILRKLQDIEILKKILLSKEQQIILKKHRRQIDKNGFCIKKEPQNYIQNNNQIHELDNCMIQQKSKSVLDQLGIKIQEQKHYKDTFNSCYKLNEIKSLDDSEIQEPVAQTPKT